jgi:5-methylcytosine-specific restriction endonuclease McrA
MGSSILQVRKCCHCETMQPFENFQHFNGKPSGWCRSCRTGAEQRRRKDAGMAERIKPTIYGASKECLECREIKSLSAFPPSKRGRCERGPYCRFCFSIRFQPIPAQVREATQRYRDRNRDWWRSLHRLTQFNRKSKSKAQSDGTVTKAAAEKLYSVRECAYCGNRIPRKNRTLDHVVPLSKGGRHSVSNLVMACRSCNSAKGAR